MWFFFGGASGLVFDNTLERFLFKGGGARSAADVVQVKTLELLVSGYWEGKEGEGRVGEQGSEFMQDSEEEEVKKSEEPRRYVALTFW